MFVWFAICTTFFFLRGENAREIDKSGVSVAFIGQQVTSAFRTIG